MSERIKMRNTIGKVCNAAATALVALVVLLVLLLFGGRLFGVEVFVVQSGSMEPSYHVGSVVYVKDTDPGMLKAGDVITYRLTENMRGTHRIIEIVEEDGSRAFRTKGDANDGADAGLVYPEDIVGKVIMTIPYLGYLINYIQQPPGSYVAVTVGAVILLLSILPDIIFQPNNKEEIQ